MSDYNDVPMINALYLEQQQVQQGISLIDAGGTLKNFFITPPLAPLETEPGPTPDPPLTLGPGMGASITLTEPATPETMAALRAQLVVYDNELTVKLAELGVTNTPPERR